MSDLHVEFIRNNLLLIVVALVSGGMLIWPFVRRGTGGPYVDAARATQLINREDALVIDVRDPGEYGAGHVLGARNVPVARIGPQAEMRADLGKRKDRPLIVYCDGGARAGKAAAALRQQGYTQVVSLSGGLGAWQAAGLPVEK